MQRSWSHDGPEALPQRETNTAWLQLRRRPQCAVLYSLFLTRGSSNASQSDVRVFGALSLAAVCWAACVAAQWASVDAAAARWGLAAAPAAVPGFSYGQTVLVFLLAAFYSLVDAMARPERRNKAIGAVYVSLVCSTFYAAVAATRVPCFLQPWGARLVPARYITWCFTNPLVRCSVESRRVRSSLCQYIPKKGH